MAAPQRRPIGRLTADLADLDGDVLTDPDLRFARRCLEVARGEGERDFSAIWRETIRHIERRPVRSPSEDASRSAAINALLAFEPLWRSAYYRIDPPARPKPPTNGNGHAIMLDARDLPEIKRLLAPPLPKRRCAVCKRRFTPGDYREKLCSDECRLARRRQREAATRVRQATRSDAVRSSATASG